MHIFSLFWSAARLPLALALAGRLVDNLGLAENGADWAGVPALIRDELQEGESVNSQLSATIAIRASVAAIRWENALLIYLLYK